MSAESEVVDLARDLIRMDTSNYGDGSGPGERSAAEYVAAKLDDVGIEAQIIETGPGRANVIAHWGPRTDGSLLVHGHLDVVPAVAADWRTDPFAGEIAAGYLWGRGAVDMKDFDAIALAVVRQRAREGREPRRGVTLAFTADEEAGGHHGAEVLVRDHADLFSHCTEAVGEVGGFSTTVRGRRMYLIEAAEKGMAWLRLSARGAAGHGSMVHADNAVTRLATAVARVGAHDWGVQLTPAMRTLLASVAELAGTEATPENAAALIDEFGPASRMLGAAIRQVSNPPGLQAGYKVNVVPSEATALLDGRFLPGTESEFFATLAELVGPGVEIEEISRQSAWEEPFETPLVDAITAAILSEDRDALVAPYLMSAGTDAKHFRKLGISTYGFAPLRLPDDLDFTALFHGVDERVPLDALEFGTRVFDRFLDLA